MDYSLCHRSALSTLSNAFLRSIKATKVGDRFSFLLPMTLHSTKRWSKQDRSGLNLFCSSESMSFDSNQLVSLQLRILQKALRTAGPAEAVRPVRLWPDHFFTQAKKKEKFLHAWQRNSLKYSANAATSHRALATIDRPWSRISSPQARLGVDILHCGSKLGRGFCARTHNTCSVTCHRPKVYYYTNSIVNLYMYMYLS